MARSLFTVVCEFDGGTYVSQVRASDERHALIAWAALLQREKPVPSASDRIAASVIDEDSLTRIDDLIDVWCWTARVDDKLVLTNVVRSA